MRLIILVFSFIVAVPFVWSQSVGGVVLDSSRAVLPRATVRLIDETGSEIARSLTDSRGHFRFEQVAPSSCRVEAGLIGFRSQTVGATSGSELEVVLEVAPVRENVVVTASRTEAPTSQTGAPTTVLDERFIEARQQLLASSLLRSVPGITVVRIGGVGNVTSVFVRGGESDYNKVLLDGIPLNEPGGTFEFSNIAEEDLDHIEVVRGPQSALFGSDAMASTIQLLPERGDHERTRPAVFLSFEAGKFKTLHGRAGVSGGYRQLDYSFRWSRLNTDNQESNNAFENNTLSGNLGIGLGQGTTVRLILRGDFGHVGTPGQTAFERADRDAVFRKADGYSGIVLRNRTASVWNQSLIYTFARTRQVSRNLFLDPPYTPSFQGHVAPFQFSDFLFDFLNDARRAHLAYQSDLTLGSTGRAVGQHVLSFVFDWDGERAFIADRLSTGPPTRARRENFGGTFQDQAIWGRLALTNGFRVEQNGSFGRSVVPRSSVSFFVRDHGDAFGATKLKFNFGLGIKEPTFIESFSPPPFAGNPSLRPERARSFDYGIEQRFWNDRGKLELNGFNNAYRDLISFRTTSFVPFQGTYFNIAQTQADGAEASVEVVPWKSLRLVGSYTYLQSEVERSAQPTSPVFRQGQSLFRRPKHSGTLFVSWAWKRLSLNSNTVFVGKRVDSDLAALNPALTSNPGYRLWDVGWSYRSSHRITYFGAFENVLNQRYMEALGFPALRASYRTGARVTF